MIQNQITQFARFKIDKIYLRQIIFPDNETYYLYGYLADTVTPFVFTCNWDQLEHILIHMDQSGENIINAICEEIEKDRKEIESIEVESITNLEEYYIDNIIFSVIDIGSLPFSDLYDVRAFYTESVEFIHQVTNIEN